jgi:uncharacterized protein
METLNSDDPRFARFCGTYVFQDGQVVFVGGLLGSTVLTLHDFQSRRIGALTQDIKRPSTFQVGPALFTQEPVEITLTFECDADGHVRTVGYRGEGAVALRGTRLGLAQEEVRFVNGDVTLGGTLFLPEGSGPHAAVVLVHGSGSQTRSCVRLHAEYFARHGIAALAYDKRGSGESSAGRDDFRELARDALAGVRLLRRHSQLDPTRVGLCGSSQGGWVAPLAAIEAPDEVAFAILVAGPAVSIAEQNRQNVEYSMRVAGFPESQVAAGVRQALAFNELMRTGEGWDEFRTLVRQAEIEGWVKYALSPTLTEPPPKPAAGPRRGMDEDPTSALEHVSCPVLALFGERDTVVPPEENAPLMDAAVRRGGHPDHRVVVIPGANHLFHLADPSGEFGRSRSFLPMYLETMVRWMKQLSL